MERILPLMFLVSFVMMFRRDSAKFCIKSCSLATPEFRQIMILTRVGGYRKIS